MIRRAASIASLLLLVALLAGCAVSVTARPAALTVATASVPTSEDQCKDGGWSGLRDAEGKAFRNQGDCVSYVASN